MLWLLLGLSPWICLCHFLWARLMTISINQFKRSSMQKQEPEPPGGGLALPSNWQSPLEQDVWADAGNSGRNEENVLLRAGLSTSDLYLQPDGSSLDSWLAACCWTCLATVPWAFAEVNQWTNANMKTALLKRNIMQKMNSSLSGSQDLGLVLVSTTHF